MAWTTTPAAVSAVPPHVAATLPPQLGVIAQPLQEPQTEWRDPGIFWRPPSETGMYPPSIDPGIVADTEPWNGDPGIVANDAPWTGDPGIVAPTPAPSLEGDTVDWHEDRKAATLGQLAGTGASTMFLPGLVVGGVTGALSGPRLGVGALGGAFIGTIAGGLGYAAHGAMSGVAVKMTNPGPDADLGTRMAVMTGVTGAIGGAIRPGNRAVGAVVGGIVGGFLGHAAGSKLDAKLDQEAQARTRMYETARPILT